MSETSKHLFSTEVISQFIRSTKLYLHRLIYTEDRIRPNSIRDIWICSKTAKLLVKLSCIPVSPSSYPLFLCINYLILLLVPSFSLTHNRLISVIIFEVGIAIRLINDTTRIAIDKNNLTDFRLPNCEISHEHSKKLCNEYYLVK